MCKRRIPYLSVGVTSLGLLITTGNRWTNICCDNVLSVMKDMEAKVASKAGLSFMDSVGGATAGAQAGAALAMHTVLPITVPISLAKLALNIELKSDIANHHRYNMGVIERTFGMVKYWKENGKLLYDRSTLCEECAKSNTCNTWSRESKKISKGWSKKISEGWFD